MPFIIISFFVGTLVSTATLCLLYRNIISTMKEDARKALLEQANESFGAGWMRCYSDEVVRNKRTGYDNTVILSTIS